MWRFIAVTFGFLGVAFYQLSGGADYAPREGSRQHAAQNAAQNAAITHAAAPARAVPSPSTAPVISPVTAQRRSNAVKAAPDTRTANADNARVILASAKPDADAPRHTLTLRRDPGVATVAADPDKIARLVAAASAATTEARAPEPRALAAAATEDTGDSGDLRVVDASRVNLRAGPGTGFAVIDQLMRGSEVAVLQDTGDGWVELRALDTGQIGWMADFLLIALN